MAQSLMLSNVCSSQAKFDSARSRSDCIWRGHTNKRVLRRLRVSNARKATSCRFPACRTEECCPFLLYILIIILKSLKLELFMVCKKINKVKTQEFNLISFDNTLYIFLLIILIFY